MSLPLGSLGEEMKDINQVFVHEKFNIPPDSRYYDIAILKIDALEFSNNVKPICMAQTQINPYLRQVVSPGWGADRVNGPAKDILHEIDLTIFDTR